MSLGVNELWTYFIKTEWLSFFILKIISKNLITLGKETNILIISLTIKSIRLIKELIKMNNSIKVNVITVIVSGNVINTNSDKVKDKLIFDSYRINLIYDK